MSVSDESFSKKGSQEKQEERQGREGLSGDIWVGLAGEKEDLQVSRTLSGNLSWRGLRSWRGRRSGVRRRDCPSRDLGGPLPVSTGGCLLTMDGRPGGL